MSERLCYLSIRSNFFLTRTYTGKMFMKAEEM